MDWDLETRTSEALEALEQGETVEDILNRYPENADALRPILEMAHELQALPLGYSVSAQQASHQTMLAEARKLQGRPAPALTRFSALRRLSLAFGVVLVLFVAATALLAQPVSAALPGQALYPVKRAAEAVRLRLAADPAVLERRFREQRHEELLTLLAEGAEAEADCYGTIRTFSADSWQTEEFVLFVTVESIVAGEVAMGASFEGRCLARDGQLFALDVRITGPGKLLPEPPSPTPAPAPTETLTPTPTATVTPDSPLPAGPAGPAATPDDDDDSGDDDSDDSDDSGDDDRDDSGDDDSDDESGDDDSDDDSGDDDSDDDSNG